VDFVDFVRRRGDRHLRTAVLLTGDWQAAQDLTQTALTELYRVWDRLDTSTDPDAYLRRIMVNTRRTWWRARWRRETPLAVVPDHGSSDDAGERYAVAEVVRKALRSLPARQRTAMVLRYFDDLSETQTAELMQISVGSVKTHTHRGLAAMRKSLPADLLVAVNEERGRGGVEP
jgi:RNA polymerase sigma-70 factor (sigma-E family)